MLKYVLDIKSISSNAVCFLPLLIFDVLGIITLKLSLTNHMFDSFTKAAFGLIVLCVLVLAVTVIRTSVKLACYIMLGNPEKGLDNILDGAKVMSLYSGICKCFRKSLSTTREPGAVADKTLKLNVYSTLISILSIYPAVSYAMDEFSLDRAISSVKRTIESKGQSFLGRSWIVSSSLLAPFSVVAVTTFFSWKITFTFLVVYLVAFFVTSFIHLSLLSEIEESNSPIEFYYEAGMSSSKIASMNSISVDWYTERVLSESLHIVFSKQEEKSDGEQKSGEGQSGVL